MSKKVYFTVVILSLLLCGSIVFLGFSIRYGLTHQATKQSGSRYSIGNKFGGAINSEFVVKNID